MLKLKLSDGELVAREDISSGRVRKIDNTRDLNKSPVDFSDGDIIVLDFPTFKDGRAFSQARALRDQGFTGDIRAVGGLFRDQLAFAARCGITSFDLETDEDIEGLRVSVGRYLHHYQRPGPAASAWEARS